jgi:hypothetical protein
MWAFHQAIGAMSDGTNVKKMAQNMLFCLTKICTKILQHILGYSFCTKHLILVQFCQRLLI